MSQKTSTSSRLPPWIERAREYIGVTEDPGPKNNTDVLNFFNSTDLRQQEPTLTLTDEIPWCAAFVTYCLSQTTTRIPSHQNPHPSMLGADTARPSPSTPRTSNPVILFFGKHLVNTSASSPRFKATKSLLFQEILVLMVTPHQQEKVESMKSPSLYPPLPWLDGLALGIHHIRGHN